MSKKSNLPEVPVGSALRRISHGEVLTLLASGKTPQLFILEDAPVKADVANDKPKVLEDVKVRTQKSGALCLPSRMIRQIGTRSIVFVNKRGDSLSVESSPGDNSVTSYRVSPSSNVTISSGVLSKIGGGGRFNVKLLAMGNKRILDISQTA